MSYFPTIAGVLLIINEVRNLVIPDGLLWMENSLRKGTGQTTFLFTTSWHQVRCQ